MNQKHREKSSQCPFAQVPSNTSIGSKRNSLHVSTVNNGSSSFTDIRDKTMTKQRLGEERVHALWQVQGKTTAHDSNRRVDNDNEQFLQDDEDNCSNDGSESSLSGRFRRTEERFDRDLYSFYGATRAFSSPPTSPASITLSSSTDESDDDDDASGYTGLVDLRKELDQVAVELSFALNEKGEVEESDLPTTPKHIPELSSESYPNKSGNHSLDSFKQNHLPNSKDNNTETHIPSLAWYYLGFGRVANVGVRASSWSFSHFVPQNQDLPWSLSHALVPKTSGTARYDHCKTYGWNCGYVASSPFCSSSSTATTATATATAAVLGCNPPSDTLTIGDDARLKSTQVQEDFSSTIPHLADFYSLSLIDEYNAEEAEEMEGESDSIFNIEGKMTEHKQNRTVLCVLVRV